MTNLQERQVTEQFLERGDDSSFTDLFHAFTPQLVAFYTRRGHQLSVAEDLAQEVMFTVYRSARQLRDRSLFRAWLFKIARHAACRHYAKRGRDVPTVDLENLNDVCTSPNPNTPRPSGSEFQDWMAFLDPHEREIMTLRFEEEWEYHEIAAAKCIPIGTVQWRVFKSKKKLASYLAPCDNLLRKAA